jgi:hypothetical protein
MIKNNYSSKPMQHCRSINIKRAYLKVESIETHGRRPEVNELNCKISGRQQLGLAARLPPFSLTFIFYFLY